MFGRLTDWRRVTTRYDRCPKVFASAIALAATVIFWLWVLTLGFLKIRPIKTKVEAAIITKFKRLSKPGRFSNDYCLLKHRRRNHETIISKDYVLDSNLDNLPALKGLKAKITTLQSY